MTDAAVLTTLLAPLTTELEAKRQALESQWEADVADNNRRFDALLTLHGAKRCPKCGGTGTLDRPFDSGIMRRFGLQDWHPCLRCGGERRGLGSKDVPGRGFVPLEG